MAEAGILHEDSNVELVEGEILEKHPVGRRRFTADEYLRLAEVGILYEDDRVELIEGEILEMAAIGNRHLACVNRLTMLFMEGLGRAVVVHVPNPVRLSDRSEPEPNVALLRPRADFYAGKRPTPEDVLLLIEVSETVRKVSVGSKSEPYESIKRGEKVLFCRCATKKCASRRYAAAFRIVSNLFPENRSSYLRDPFDTIGVPICPQSRYYGRIEISDPPTKARGRRRAACSPE